MKKVICTSILALLITALSSCTESVSEKQKNVNPNVITIDATDIPDYMAFAGFQGVSINISPNQQYVMDLIVAKIEKNSSQEVFRISGIEVPDVAFIVGAKGEYLDKKSKEAIVKVATVRKNSHSYCSNIQTITCPLPKSGVPSELYSRSIAEHEKINFGKDIELMKIKILSSNSSYYNFDSPDVVIFKISIIVKQRASKSLQ